jgi:hypothetical protein
MRRQRVTDRTAPDRGWLIGDLAAPTEVRSGIAPGGVVVTAWHRGSIVWRRCLLPDPLGEGDPARFDLTAEIDRARLDTLAASLALADLETGTDPAPLEVTFHDGDTGELMVPRPFLITGNDGWWHG